MKGLPYGFLWTVNYFLLIFVTRQLHSADNCRNECMVSCEESERKNIFCLTFTNHWANFAITNWWYFSYFFQKTGFDILCKLSPLETICMKCQNLFSGKMKKNISICHLLKILPRVLSVNEIFWNKQKWKLQIWFYWVCWCVILGYEMLRRPSSLKLSKTVFHTTEIGFQNLIHIQINDNET